MVNKEFLKDNFFISNSKEKFQDMSIAPMHTAEHILNGTMVKMIGCERSRRAHIERKKSKCDYPLNEPLSAEQLQAIEDRVNEVIARDLPVTAEMARKSEVSDRFDLSRLPEDAVLSQGKFNTLFFLIF